MLGDGRFRVVSARRAPLVLPEKLRIPPNDFTDDFRYTRTRAFSFRVTPRYATRRVLTVVDLF